MTASNSAPSASITASPTNPRACSLTRVFLDGTGSSDPEEDTLTYTWSVDTPDGSAASLSSTSSSTTIIIPDKAGDYTVTLTVSDGSLSDSSEAILTAGSQPIADTALGENDFVNLTGSADLELLSCSIEAEISTGTLTPTSDTSATIYLPLTGISISGDENDCSDVGLESPYAEGAIVITMEGTMI